MDLTLILGALAVVGAVGMFWWGLTARPSAARGNLLAGLPEPASTPGPLVAVMRQLGESTQRMMPNALVDGLGVRLVQAGHPGGLDLPRLLGIKITLAGIAALLLLVNGHVLLAVIAAVGVVLPARLLGAQRPGSASGEDPGRCRRRHRPVDHLRRGRPRLRRRPGSSGRDDRRDR